jgi:hypothetical protein
MLGAMRLWLPALAVCGGCAQLLGAEDPVPANPVPPNLDSEYLLAIDLHTSDATIDGVIEMRVPVTVDADARVIDIAPIALASTAPHGDLDSLGDFFGEIANADDLHFEIEWQIDLPAAATASSVATSWQGNLLGHFPPGVTDGFCGNLDGTITAPGDAQIQAATTFAAFKVEPGDPPPPKLSCDDL